MDPEDKKVIVIALTTAVTGVVLIVSALGLFNLGRKFERDHVGYCKKIDEVCQNHWTPKVGNYRICRNKEDL